MPARSNKPSTIDQLRAVYSTTTNGTSQASPVAGSAVVEPVPRLTASNEGCPSSVARVERPDSSETTIMGPPLSRPRPFATSKTSALNAVPQVQLLSYPTTYSSTTSIPMHVNVLGTLPNASVAHSDINANGTVSPTVNEIGMTTNGVKNAVGLPINEEMCELHNVQYHRSSPPHSVSPPTNTGMTRMTRSKKRGRPVGSKSKKRRTDSNFKVARRSKVTPREMRASRLSEEEALKLARAWTRHGSNRVENSDAAMWKAIHTTCQTVYGMKHSEESLRNSWSRLVLEIQSFLAVRASIQSQLPCTSTTEVNMIALNAYQRNRKDGNKEGAHEFGFKYVATADYLSNHERFVEEILAGVQSRLHWVSEDTCGKESNGSREADPSSETHVGQGQTMQNTESELLISVPSRSATRTEAESEGDRHGTEKNDGEKMQKSREVFDQTRPSGSEKIRIGDRVEEENKLKESLTGIERQLKRSNDLFESTVRRGEDVGLLYALPKDSAEFKKILAEIMKRREMEEKSVESERSAQVNNDSNAFTIPSSNEEMNPVEGGNDVFGICDGLEDGLDFVMPYQ